ncbi:hypothetical protein GPECTOR_30g144 [Gonium pectorale]|uniref:Uncharacterized protein n=1 Tax=Gonium pectorale TaxID=33097 RepID=A0A150GDY6_GONPE|nr:hypothetical protein GPECTOR_30g144 [Gonium pectorale]|eukprot:KXZ48049.1 hypothetical protein GPECTOR_30g144 [Gonium pectorale]
MRSLVTHKKLKEIAMAQQTELAELRDALDKLKMRTYPTFTQPPPGPEAGGMPRRMPPDLKLLTGSPSMGALSNGAGAGGGASAKLSPMPSGGLPQRS